MLWLLTIVLAYFFLAWASVCDRYLLAGPLPHPKVYAFWVGFLGIFTIFLWPFGFYVPTLGQAVVALLAGANWTLACFLLYRAIFQKEVSQIVPTIGAFLPLFTLILSVFLFANTKIFDWTYLLSLILLVSGSIFITLEKEKIDVQSFYLALPAAFVFAIAFSLAKLTYLWQPFLSGFVLMRIGGALAALFFLASSQTRLAVFSKRVVLKKEVSLGFLLGQASGGLGFILQEYALFLTKPEQVPLINALEGTRYLFLFFFVLILSRYSPRILRERASRKILFQRIFAISIIGLGSAFLALSQG